MKFDRLVIGTVLSCFGLWVHEWHRVPALFGFTPDGSIFMFVIAGALVYWWYRSRSAAAAASLMVYAAISLVGGFLTVLPLGWLPFRPEQTPIHYAVHIVYATCQLPLLLFAAAELRRRSYVHAR
jgi:hypothetical protein